MEAIGTLCAAGERDGLQLDRSIRRIGEGHIVSPRTQLVWVCFVLYIRGTFVALVCVLYVFCLLVVLVVRLSVPVQVID